jgi:glucose/arabinose dehydrogenase
MFAWMERGVTRALRGGGEMPNSWEGHRADGARQRTKLAWLLALAAILASACGGEDGRDKRPSGLGEDEPGIEVPRGFRAIVFAEDLGRARHLAVRDNGDVYVRLREAREGHGLVALRDADGDHRAERMERFESTTGTGVAVWGPWLYFSSDTAVMRYRLGPDRLVPEGVPETIAEGFPDQDQHAAKSFALDGEGLLYVNCGAPSNACQEERRTRGSPGQLPCPQLEDGGGIWRFDADEPNQKQSPRRRFATGIRHAVAIDYNPWHGGLYVVQHGRDQLNSLWPGHYDSRDNAELPAEELHRVEEGEEYGWPYTYWDSRRGERMLAPEYGGDGEKPAEDGRFPDPLRAFPAHWAPNDLLFADPEGYPDRFRRGAYIAFHGSWNRHPHPQAGYKVVFVPFEDGHPSGESVVFADGFPGPGPVETPRDARYRPMGLAEGPDGALYVSDSVTGRIWKIVHG